MISLPWYLLAGGIMLVVIGCLLAGLPGSRSPGRRPIDPYMRDEDILKELKRAQPVSIASLVILAGVVCILVSICWRVLRVLF